MKLFILTRILDVITTLLNVNNYGWDIESNPLIRTIGRTGMFIPWQIAITVFIILLISTFRFKKVVYRVLSILGFITIGINLYCFICL